MKKTSNYTNKYVEFSKNRIIRKFLEYPIGGLASHWLFQGMLYMDTTERWFKLGLDAILTLLGFWILNSRVAPGTALLLGFLFAHTLNFVFNGQMWVILKHYGWVSNSFEDFMEYRTQLVNRFRSETSVRKLLAYGSLSRNEWRESSDLDIRVIREPGLWNGIRVCWLVLKERTRATFARFPLDVFVLDSEAPLVRMRTDEEGIDLLV